MRCPFDYQDQGKQEKHAVLRANISPAVTRKKQDKAPENSIIIGYAIGVILAE